MKNKYLILILILYSGMASFAESVIINKPINPKRSAIQSTNAVFTEKNIDTSSNSYYDAIKEIEAKIAQEDSNYTYYIPLVDLYIKTSQFDKAYSELTFLNNLAKSNKLTAEVLQSASELEASLEKNAKYNNDAAIDLTLLNLILQKYSKAQEYLAICANNPKFLETFKEVFDTTGNYQAGINLLDRVSKINPLNKDLKKIKAEYLMQLNQKDSAINEYTSLALVMPEDTEIKYNLYNLLVSKNVAEKELVSKVCPQVSEEKAYAEISGILLEKKNYSEAKIWAEKLIKKYPENVNGYIVMSEVYKAEGNLKDCYDMLKLVRDKADDKDTIAKYNVALAKLSDEPVKQADGLMNSGLYQQALSVLQDANQQDLYVMLSSARANYFLNNKQKAFELLNKAMSLYPDNSDVFYYFAYIFYMEKDLSSARNYIEKSLNADKNNQFSLKLLDVLNKTEADTYLNKISNSIDNQNYTEAMKLTEEALNIDSKNSALFFYKAMILIAQNNYAAATAPLYKAIELNKDNLDAYYYLGVAFDNLSEPENALEYYKEFIKRLPLDDFGESEKKDYANLRIKKLQG